ncbi:MAG: site-specific integrase [Kouleothrix sp.]|jgi:integrase|nr:site-specific integrase [Kouleothrix sp.]
MPRTVGGKVPSKWRVADRADGLAQLKQRLRDQEDGLVLNRIHTVDTWLDHWLDHVVKPSCRATTRESHAWIVQHYIRPTLGKKRLDKLTTPDVRGWVNDLANRYAIETMKNAFRRLNTALEVAVNDSLIRRNPCDGVTLPKGEQRQAIALTEDQVGRLLHTANKNPILPLLVLAVSTGMRRGELLGLRWKNVTLDGPEPKIAIVEQLQIVDKKPALVPPKSKASKRDIPLDPTLVEILKHHQRAQLGRKAKLITRWIEHGLVFSSLRGTPIGGRNLGRTFSLLLGKAELPHIRFHDLRHTAGSLMLAAGVPMVDVSKLLGHSSVSVTASIYAHSYTENKRAAVAAVTKKLSL